MRTSIKLEGLDELIKGIRDFDTKARFRIVRNASRAGANVVKRALKAAAPKGKERSTASDKYGSLKSNIKSSQAARTPYYKVHTNDAFWGAFLDTGTGRYNVAPGPRAKGPAARTHIRPLFWFTRTVEGLRTRVSTAMINNARTSIQREFDKIKGARR
jgi:HK97 gp10 family phage protein